MTSLNTVAHLQDVRELTDDGYARHSIIRSVLVALGYTDQPGYPTAEQIAKVCSVAEKMTIRVKSSLFVYDRTNGDDEIQLALDPRAKHIKEELNKLFGRWSDKIERMSGWFTFKEGDSFTTPVA